MFILGIVLGTLTLHLFPGAVVNAIIMVGRRLVDPMN